MTRDFSKLVFSGASICSLLPLLYCYFAFPLIFDFQLLIIQLISLGYLMTKRRQTAISFNFRLFWAFLVDFIFTSLKIIKYNQSIFSGTIFQQKIFLLGLFRSFRVACVNQNKLLISSIHQLLHCAIRLQHFFHYLISVRICRYFKRKLFFECCFEETRSFVTIFFHAEKFGCEHWGLFKKSSFLGRYCLNMLTQGLVVPVSVINLDSKVNPIVLFLYS